MLIIPVNTLIAVVLPAPLCPNKQKICDSYKDKDILSTALRLPNFLSRFLIIILGLASEWYSSWYKAELISTSYEDSFNFKNISFSFASTLVFRIKNNGSLAIPYSLGIT